MDDDSQLATFLCGVVRPEVFDTLDQFLTQFELVADRTDDPSALLELLDDASRIQQYQCVFLDEALGRERVFKILTVARYLSHTRDLSIFVILNPGSRVLPFYQAGATLCLHTPLAATELESAFDQLFAEEESHTVLDETSLLLSPPEDS